MPPAPLSTGSVPFAPDAPRRLRERFLALWSWEPSAWGIPRGWAAFVVLFFAGMIVVSLVGEQGLVSYWLLSKESRTLAEHVAGLEERETELLREIDALRTDPGYIEQLARRQLGFVKPGEVVVQLPAAQARDE